MKSLGDEAPTDPYWAEVYDGRFGHVVFGHEAFDDGVQTFLTQRASIRCRLRQRIDRHDYRVRWQSSYITVSTTKEAEPMVRG